MEDVSGTMNSFFIKSLFTQNQIANGNIKEMLAGFKDVNLTTLFFSRYKSELCITWIHVLNKLFEYAYMSIFCTKKKYSFSYLYTI